MPPKCLPSYSRSPECAPFHGKKDFTDVVKDLEMERLSWIIWEWVVWDHKGPYQ